MFYYRGMNTWDKRYGMVWDQRFNGEKYTRNRGFLCHLSSRFSHFNLFVMVWLVVVIWFDDNFMESSNCLNHFQLPCIHTYNLLFLPSGILSIISLFILHRLNYRTVIWLQLISIYACMHNSCVIWKQFLNPQQKEQSNTSSYISISIWTLFMVATELCTTPLYGRPSEL